VFDLLHIGHIRHFEQAKQLGDVLVVTVTPDSYVNKGSHRPAFAQDLRAEAIASLQCVDYVAINAWPTAVETIRLLKPHLYVKGPDYKDYKRDLTGKILDEEQAIKEVNGQIVFTDDLVFSSSSLINNYMSVFPKEVVEYLAGFSRRYSVERVLSTLQNVQSIKVLVVGEPIIDEYQYCEQIGKSAKEPVLAVRYLWTEKFAGGALAIVNHVANFSDRVSLVTFLGQEMSQEDFICQQLNNRVEKLFLYKPGSPTIVKRRFVESYLAQKLFEVYEIDDGQLGREENRALCEKLDDVLPLFDVVIVSDYGHGMLSEDAIDVLCRKARFLAVNTQSNAGNKGFSTISKYPRADYICLAHHEIALEERNRRASLKDMILSVSQRLKCGRVLVTCGKDGNLGYSEEEGFVQVPAFANQVVDRMGAGDAVLSLTALCIAQRAPMEVVSFIGNVVGAQAVATLGHRRSVDRVALSKHIESLLK
jgi:rfaE bifunctional protein kinase chain/domain